MAVGANRQQGRQQDRRRAFEAAWPEVEARLRRVLAARRVPVSDHDDYLQEVAARALAALAAGHLRFESAGDLVPWAATVLRRLHVDAQRKADRVGFRRATDPTGATDTADLADMAETTATTDIAVEVEARMELDAVAKVMATWSPDNRRLLLLDTEASADANPDPDPDADPGLNAATGASQGRKPNSFYVRRHRLRLKLIAAVEGLGGFVGNVWRRLDPTASIERLRAAGLGPQLESMVSGTLAPMAAACAMALLLAPFVPSHDAGAAETAAPSRRDGVLTAAQEASPGASATATAAGTASGASGNATRSQPGHDLRPDDQRNPQRGGVAFPHVMERQEVHANVAGEEQSAGVEQRRGPQPLACYRDKPVLGDGCVGEPDDFPTLPVVIAPPGD